MKKRCLLLIGVLLLRFSLAQDRSTTLVMGGDFSDLITLDPQQSYEFTGSLVLDNLYETLVRFEGLNLSEVKPALAESWTVEAQDDGSNKIIFTLTDATFSSGNPVTAADVVYSVDRAIQMAEAGQAMPSVFLFTDVAKLVVGSTVAVDDKTVEMSIPAGANPNIVLNLLTFNIGGIVDSKVLMENEVDGDFGNAYLQENSAGSGPYMLERWERDAQVILVANPENTRRVGTIQRVIMRFMKEASVQQAALTSGEVDVAYNPTPEFFATASTDAKFTALKTDNFSIQYLGMNSGEGKPFADNRVRDAVRYAIDQDAIIGDLLSDLGLKSQTIIPNGLLGFDDTIYFEHDPEKAKALVAEAGADGLEFEFLVSDGSCGGGVACADLGAKIQSDLAAVGLVANIRILPESEQLPIYRAQEAEMVLLSWSPDYPDPDGNATPMSNFDAKSLAWRNMWQNDTASKLAADASLESDSAKRVEMYAELTALVAKEGPFAILYQPFRPIITQASLQGYVRNAQGNTDFDKISKE
jgi:peptide/nickel transport system substrate-binding protein